MSQQFPFFDRTTGQRCTYDEANNEIIYPNGARRRRAANEEAPEIPRSVASERDRQLDSRTSAISQSRRQVMTSGQGYPPPTSPDRNSSYTYDTTRASIPAQLASAQLAQTTRDTRSTGAREQSAAALASTMATLNLGYTQNAVPSSRTQAQQPSSQRRQSQSSQVGSAQVPRNLSQYSTGPVSLDYDTLTDQTEERTFETRGLRVLEAYNRSSGVRTLIASDRLNRKEDITEPSLLRDRITAQGLLLGSGEGEQERLYTTFRVRSHSFFTVGRVFLILWVEPAGSTAVTSRERNDSFLPGRYQNELIYSKVRRFVVIRAGEMYCSALPIMSYGSQGVSKPGVNKSEHAIIHTGAAVPQPLDAERPRRGEQGMRHTAIRVTPDDPTDSLDPMSRLDFGKVSTVQHNVKVKAFGQVHPGSMSALTTQFTNVWYGDAMTETIVSNQSASQASEASQSRAGHVPGVSLREIQPTPNVYIPPVARPVSNSQAQRTTGSSSTGRVSASGEGVASASSQRSSYSIQRSQAGSTAGTSRPPASAGSRASRSITSTESGRRIQGSASQRIPESESDNEDESDDSEEPQANLPRAGRSRSAADASTARRAQSTHSGAPSSRQSTRAGNAAQQQSSASPENSQAAALSEEARSAQAAFQRLRQQGYSDSEAITLLAGRLTASGEIGREEAQARIVRLLRYRG